MAPRWLPPLCALTLFVTACAHPQAGTPTHSLVREAPAARVVIVGGGLAGLVTAYELEKRGISVHLLEMADRFGGKVATAHYGPGLAAEYGMQEIWSKSPLAQIAKELKVPLDTGESAYSSVFLGGKLHAYSQETDEEYFRALFSDSDYRAQQAWLRRAETLWTELENKGVTPTLAPLQDISFASWLEEEKLPPRVNEWVKLTLECELGADSESFSALSGLAELRVFLFGGEQALHVRGGNSRLIDALAGHIRGGKSLRSKVLRVERQRDDAGRLRARVSYLQDNVVRTLEADRVVVAVPWLMLHFIQLDPPLPPEVWDSLMTLGRGQYTVVHLLIDKKAHALWGGVDDRPFPVLTRGPLGVIYGVAEPSPPEQPLEVFSLLVYGRHAREFHLAPHEQKRKEVVAGLDALWPGFATHVRDASIYPYHPAAIPFWPAGRSPFDERAGLLFRPVDGLYLAGDYLVSSHSEGAVIAGQRQAEAIARELASEAPAGRLAPPAPGK